MDLTRQLLEQNEKLIKQYQQESEKRYKEEKQRHRSLLASLLGGKNN